MSIKMDRLGNTFVEEIARILHEDIEDKNLKDVSITHCKITNDLSFAKVYFTCFDEDKKTKVISLNKAANFIKSLLCDRVDIRKMPDLEFIYDESIDYGVKIENIIKEIKKEE